MTVARLGGSIARRAAGAAAGLCALVGVGCTWPQPADPLDPGRKAAGEVGRPVLGFLWKSVIHDRGGATAPQEFATAALAIGGGLPSPTALVGSTGGVLWAYDLQNARVRWQAAIGAVSSAPLVEGDVTYVGTDDGTALALATATGKVLWRYPTRGAIWHTPVSWGELLIFANDADHVYAVEKKTGKWRWQVERDTPEEFTVTGHAGVVVDGDRVYTGFADGHLAAITAASGEVVWTRSLAGAETQFVDVDTTPIVVGGQVFAASTSGGVWAVAAADGSETWRLPLKGAAGMSRDGRRLYVAAADSGLLALDLAGHVLWRQGLYRAGDPATPLVDGDYLFLSTAQAGLFVIDKTSGALVQSWNPGFGISAAPIVAGERLMVLSNAGIFYVMSVTRY
jgi:outer membrane protein assembly factor BamB